MAGIDYILCKKCHTKIIYDGDDNGRERLLSRWGSVDVLLCPDCVKLYEESVKTAEKCMRKNGNNDNI